MSTCRSDYLIGERVPTEVLQRQVKYFSDMNVMCEAFDSIHILVAILNNLRQIVFANKTFLKALEGVKLQDIVGKRLGELMCCKHAFENELGCGTSESCRSCKVASTLITSFESNNEATGEAVIVRSTKGYEESMNFQEHVVPFFAEEDFYIVSLIDITDTVKRRSLERIFFHDVINTAGSLRNYIGLIKEEAAGSIKAEMEFVEEAFNDMLGEIQGQRQLLEAENGELRPDYITMQSCDVIRSVKKMYEYNDCDEGKFIAVDEKMDCLYFKSDYILLKRVLGNMLKNALEETEKGDAVAIGCNRIHIEERQFIEFWVKNKKYMPTETQNQVFSRAFSTKGRGRGLGTYSMKLLGVRYLGGMVGFKSDRANGTMFYIRLPLA